MANREAPLPIIEGAGLVATGGGSALVKLRSAARALSVVSALRAGEFCAYE